MATVLTWTGSPDNQANCKKVTGDGTHIYAAHACAWNFGPLSKIDPLTMTTVSTWFPDSDQYNTYDVAFDGTYLFAALSLTPAKVSKIDPATLTTVSVWTGASGQSLVRAIIAYKDNIYMGGTNANPRIIKIDPTTMVTSDTWSDTSTVLALKVGGEDFYAGLNISPARVYQFGVEPPSEILKVSGSISHRLVAAGLI
jgi:hypothetical protein